MNSLDSLESIQKRYDKTIKITDMNDVEQEAGIFAAWAHGFTDVTCFMFWLEYPGCDGNLTPIVINIQRHSSTDYYLTKEIVGQIRIYNYPKPKNWPYNGTRWEEKE